MKLEVEIPDFETLLAFKRAKPPEGISIREHTVALHGDDISGFTRIIIEFGVAVSAGVIVELIKTAFAKRLHKHPNDKPKVYYREKRIEHTEIIRIIEEVRIEEPNDKHAPEL